MKYSLVLLFSACFLTAFSQSTDEIVKLAQEKLAQKDYQYSMVLIEKAINENDSDQWLYLIKAEIEANMYGPSEALKTIRKVIKKNPAFAEAYNRAGTFYSSAGFADSSIAMYSMAIKLTPNNDSLKYIYITNRGAAKASFRDYEGALKDYEKVLSFNPKDVGALNNISDAYSELGYTEKAIACLKKVLTIDSNDIGAYVNLGFIYSKLDSIDLSLQFFDKALKLAPDEPLVYNNRGFAYYKKGDYDKALDDINYSIKLYPTNPYAYKNLALVYIATNDLKEACTALGYAEYYGYTERYGDEVSKLIKQTCYKKQ